MLQHRAEQHQTGGDETRTHCFLSELALGQTGTTFTLFNTLQQPLWAWAQGCRRLFTHSPPPPHAVLTTIYHNTASYPGKSMSERAQPALSCWASTDTHLEIKSLISRSSTHGTEPLDLPGHHQGSRSVPYHNLWKGITAKQVITMRQTDPRAPSTVFPRWTSARAFSWPVEQKGRCNLPPKTQLHIWATGLGKLTLQVRGEHAFLKSNIHGGRLTPPLWEASPCQLITRLNWQGLDARAAFLPCVKDACTHKSLSFPPSSAHQGFRLTDEPCGTHAHVKTARHTQM